MQIPLKERVKILEKNPLLFDYYKNFYWILLNSITAYRNLSTELVQGHMEKKKYLIYQAGKVYNE